MILITGGLGFIGLHTARRFLDVGEQVVLTQFKVRREPDFIKAELGKRAFIETLDVTSTHDVSEIVRKHKVTGIVHLAVPGLGALTAAEDYRVNVMGFLNILEAARLFDVKRVSLASSVAVYAGLAVAMLGGPGALLTTAGAAAGLLTVLLSVAQPARSTDSLGSRSPV